MLFGLLVFGAIVFAVFSLAATYNSLVAAAERTTRAWNDLDALLRQRHDEIPKLVETCEPHFTAERGAFDRVLEARSAVFAARQTRAADALGQAERSLRAAVTDVIARAADHPELAASQAFGMLRQRHATIDSEIAERRERYNDAVRQYNAAVARIPGNFVALLGGFRSLRPLDVGSSADGR